MNSELLQKYAEFAVKIGTNPQPEQTLIIVSPIEAASFARMCANTAYKDCKVKDVVIQYNDEKLDRIRMENGTTEILTDIKPHKLAERLDYLESDGSACFLYIIAEDPEIFKGLDTAKINAVNKASRTALLPARKYTMNNLVQWSIVALPTPAWATKVFPGIPTNEAVEKLGQAIFDVCRVTNGNPVAEWKSHLAYLNKCKNYINSLNLDHVHLTNSLGTDLTIGLAKDSLWEGAISKTPKGYEFLANIPTEEIFTAPHKDKVNGIVFGTKPYVYNGNIIKDFWVKFKDGKVIEHGAKEGAELLGQLLDTDEASRSIGELAFVPSSSPINKSGILFYETLFDENAACHIAFGDGYPSCIEGGNNMTQEELTSRGLNHSLIHEDVMIGSDDLQILGYTKTGSEILIFQKGEWVIK
ncbi:MAG: aminopeptidase [Treponema sp. CETP13]|nr:MAG: aminopeptidase [Treponema sp. CETP13]